MARSSTVALGALAVGLLGLGASLLETAMTDQERDIGLLQTQALTRQLGLTDPALMTEARYGRHLALADRHTPFQDHPLAFDHFPTGSLLPAPRP